ncbi:MAG: hypothetical protein EAZ61_01445 [Oscillatoriales cyanobacterium]|nr:MAG: hypothetical protein EAZ61_01445 [Oscillatoriales cyanobacterium]
MLAFLQVFFSFLSEYLNNGQEKLELFAKQRFLIRNNRKNRNFIDDQKILGIQASKPFRIQARLEVFLSLNLNRSSKKNHQNILHQ